MAQPLAAACVAGVTAAGGGSGGGGAAAAAWWRRCRDKAAVALTRRHTARRASRGVMRVSGDTKRGGGCVAARAADYAWIMEYCGDRLRGESSDNVSVRDAWQAKRGRAGGAAWRRNSAANGGAYAHAAACAAAAATMLLAAWLAYWRRRCVAAALRRYAAYVMRVMAERRCGAGLSGLLWSVSSGAGY